MENKYTVLVRKSRLESFAIGLELNLSACSGTLAEVEKTLRAAMELYQEDIKEHPETVVVPITSEELIEFLRDTEPEWFKKPAEDFILRPLEVHED